MTRRYSLVIEGDEAGYSAYVPERIPFSEIKVLARMIFRLYSAQSLKPPRSFRLPRLRERLSRRPMNSCSLPN